MSDSNKPQVTSDSLVGTILGGRYRIRAPLGRGGAGHVYLAVQEPLGREVAIKVLRTDIAASARQEFEQRFLREAALAGKLHHNNVVTVHDYGVEPSGLTFVAMERLEGRTLKSAIFDSPMDHREGARVLAAVARGLRHAHGQGLVHRDVKPTNIMLVRDDDGKEIPKILDFGLVKDKEEDSTLTRAGTYMGTPAYMAPEQARGDNSSDNRSDIYSLGVVAYRTFTGKLPFEADNPLGLAIAHQTKPYPPMKKRAPDVEVDPALERIVRKAMEKEPAKRYQDAIEFAQDLDAWLAGDTVAGVATPPPGSGAKRIGVAVIGAGLLVGVPVLVVGALLVGWLAGRTTTPAPTAAGTAQLQEVQVGAVVEATDPPEPTPRAKEKANAKEEAKAKKVEAPAPPPKPKVVKPKPRPKPRPKPKPVTADGVSFDGAHAGRALKWINTAPEADLRAKGVYGRAVNIILENRPFKSLEAFAGTPYIGPKTVQSVANATK